MKKKFVSALLACTLAFSTVPMVNAAIPQDYWQYQKPFQEAKAAGNHSELIPIALNVATLMETQSQSQEKLEILYTTYEALATSYQALAQYENAIIYLEKNIPIAKELGYADAVTLAEKRITQIDPMTEVYVLSQNLETIPFYSAKYEPRAGSYFGRGAEEDGNATMSQESVASFYVEFLEEEVSQFDYLISPVDNGNRIIQICLNMPQEHDSLLLALQSSSDEYIMRTMAYLAQLKSPVLLRIGGEMNVWNNISTPETFKSAYIKIAQYARQYAPNVALVFSPNSISTWGEDVMDYYPGDAYVDWVGMSAYTIKYWNPADPNGTAEYNNMFYGTGDYAECIHGLREIVETFGDTKPILISESGAYYQHKDYNLDLLGFSTTQLKNLYTYANMVYPQIKGVITFDADVPTSKFLFSISNQSTLWSTYQSVTSNNPTLLNSVSDSLSTSYIKAENYRDSLSTLSFAAFSAPVGQPAMTVNYYLDGTQVGSSSTIPYNFDLNAGAIGDGTHGLTVQFKGTDGYQAEKYYALNKSGSNITLTAATAPVSPSVSAPTVESTGIYADVPSWAETYVEFAYNNGILTGTNGYFYPDDQVTRGLAATALSNLAKGTPTAGFSSGFADVTGSEYEQGINWCVENAVMLGQVGNFGTNDYLTREAFATTLSAYAKFANVYQAPSAASVAELSKFSDANGISTWALEAMAWASEHGLITGYQNGTVLPSTYVTRVQVAVILKNFINLYA